MMPMNSCASASGAHVSEPPNSGSDISFSTSTMRLMTDCDLITSIWLSSSNVSPPNADEPSPVGAISLSRVRLLRGSIRISATEL